MCSVCVSVYFFVLTEKLYGENVWSIIFSLSRIINDYSISISSVKTLNTKTFALFARLARSLTQWILHGNVLHRRPIHIAKHTHTHTWSMCVVQMWINKLAVNTSELKCTHARVNIFNLTPPQYTYHAILEIITCVPYFVIFFRFFLMVFDIVTT